MMQQPESNPHRRETAPLLLEPSLFYAPPYDRPLEDDFAWHLVKYLNPVAALGYQVKVETPCAPFWVDFVVEHGGRRIGFECGELDAEADAAQAQLRAALIIGAGGLDVLYRFRGADLAYRLHDCLLVAARWDPELFSPRGQVNLDTLASPAARASRPQRTALTARVFYPAAVREAFYEDEAFDETEAPPPPLVVHRVSRDNPAGWIRDFDRALAHYGITDEQLGDQWARTA